MMNIVKKIINIVSLVWLTIAILTVANPDFYRFVMSKSLSGVVLACAGVAVIVFSIFTKRWEFLAASVFVVLLYLGIVWTALPISKIVTDLKWASIPYLLLFVFDVLEIGQKHKISTLLTKSVNLISIIWIAMSIGAALHPIKFWVLMSKSFFGLFFAAVVIALLVVSIFIKRYDITIACVFTFLLYFGIVWTALPFSSIVKKLQWALIPVGLIFWLNVIELKAPRLKFKFKNE